MTFWKSKLINAVIMPWIPFLSNCDGFDTHIVLYDLLEHTPSEEEGGQCKRPAYEEITIVNPIPSDGLEAVADTCDMSINCRYDEDLKNTRSSTVRWYQIVE